MSRIIILLLLTVAGRCQMQAQCSYRDHGELGGDVVLGFMFPYLAPYSHGNICSEEDVRDYSTIQLIEAALFAVKELNNNNVIPGVTVGLEAWDSCHSATVATDRGVSYLYDRKVSYAQNVGENCRNQTKAGVIGDLRGDRGPAVASLLSDAQSPIISYAATLPNLASSRFDFFSRVIPSDQTEAKVIVDLLVDRGWKYISLVYSDTLEEKAEAEIFQEEAEKAQICIATLSVIQPESFDPIIAIVNILNNQNASVVVTFLSTDAFSNFVVRFPGSSSYQFVVGHAGMISHQDLSAPLNLNFLAVSPTSLDTSASHPFDEYFKNLSPDTVDSAADRWFTSFYEDSYSCSITGGTCGSAPQTHQQMYERNPYVLSVIDSVNAMGMALQTLHATKCSGIPGPCLDFMAITPREMQDAIRNISFENDAAQEISFNSVGNLKMEKYTIWQLATAVRVPTTKIGEWVDGQISLEQDERDVLSSIVSECGVPCQDPLCMKFENGTEITAQVDGDILLAGMFAVREWDSQAYSCGSLSLEGVIRLEAMLYALDKINSDPTILPTVTLGIEGMDTCGNAQRAGHQAVELVSRYNFGRSSSGTQVSDGDKKHLYGIIGPGGNEETSSVISVVKTYGVTVIGYEANSHLLSSTSTLPNFARVVPTYINSFFAIGTVLKEWNFRYVQILLSSENFPLNSVLRSYMRQYDVCVAQGLEIPQDDGSWNATFESLKTKPDAKAILIAASSEEIQRFMGQIQNRGLIGEYFLIAGDEWLLDNEEFISGLEDVARGTLAVKTRPRSYTGFQDYFASLPSTYTRNPWFQSYWMQKFKCVLPGLESEFTTPCTGTESLDPSTDVNDETAAYVIDAVYTLAEALHGIHAETCGPSYEGVCDAMDILTGEEVFSSITLKTVTSHNEDQLPINIGYTGDGQVPYHVYNIQPGGSSEVATFQNFMLTPVQSQPAKFYNSDGSVRTLEIYSVCNKTKCLECELVGRDRVAATQGGDVWIGGFFEINEPESTQIECSDRLVLYNMQLVEAFLFAIDEINKDTSILPDLNLGGIAFDSCGSKKRVGKEIGNFYSGTVDYRPGYNANRITIAGMIGGGTSDTTQALSNTIVNLDINAISYGATASTFSSAKMFPHLLRTVPSDEKQAMAMADLMDEFGWKYISVIYSDNVYGNDIFQLFATAAAKKSICIAMTLVISKSTSSSQLDSFIDTLQTNVNARTVILLTSDLDTRSVLQAAEKKGVQNIQWVGGDTWGSRDYIITAAEKTALGAVTLQFRESETFGFHDYYTGLNPYNNNRNPWWRNFWSDTFECNLVSGRETYGINCPFYLQSLADGYVQAPEVTYVFNAVKALANGLHEAMKELCPKDSKHLCNELLNDPDELVKIIRRSSFTGGDNTTFKFDSKGDGPAEYDILNIQPGVNDTLQYTKVGSWNDGTFSVSGAQLYREGQQIGRTDTMCSGRCEECRSAQESVRQVASRPGGLQIPVLVGVHSSPTGITQTCGELREAGIVNVEAVLYAVNAINADNAILNGVTLGTTILDTCLSPGQGLSKLSSYLERTGDFSEDTEWRHVAGIIAAEDERVTQFTSSVANQFEYVQIAYSSVDSSSSEFLLQTSASLDQQLQVIQDILENFGWNFVSFISDGTDTQHVQLAEAIYNSQGEQKFCIEDNLKYERTGFSRLQTILEGSESSVIILVMSLDTADELVRGLQLDRDIVYVVMNTYPPSSARILPSLSGALVVTLPDVSDQFKRHLSSLQSGINPWYDEYMAGNVGGQLSATASTNVNNIIDAVYAMASGISALVDEQCTDESLGLCSDFFEVTTADVLDTMANQEFISDGGQRVTMQNGTVTRDFTIWTADSNGKMSMVGSWTSGTLSINSEITASKRMIKSSKTSCKSTSETSPQISPQSMLDEFWFLIAMILSGIGIITSTIFLIAILIQHHSPQAQVYSMFLCCTLLVFIILLFAQNVLFGLAPSDVICAIRRVCFNIFHTLPFLAVFLMTVRFYRILAREKRITGPRTLYINNKSQMILFVLLGTIEVLIVVQSLLLQPSEGTDFLGYCQYMDGHLPISLLYLFLLMMGTLVVSTLALCRSKTILSRELMMGLICIILCIFVVAAWIIFEIIADISLYTVVTCFVSIALGYLLLFFLIPLRVYNLWRRHDPFSDSASVVSGEFNPPRSNEYDTTINQAIGGEDNPTYDSPPSMKMDFESKM